MRMFGEGEEGSGPIPRTTLPGAASQAEVSFEASKMAKMNLLPEQQCHFSVRGGSVGWKGQAAKRKCWTGGIRQGQRPSSILVKN